MTEQLKFTSLERAARELVTYVEERTPDVGWVKAGLPVTSQKPLTWDDIVSAYHKMTAEYALAKDVTVVGEGVWMDILSRSNDEERRALGSLIANGSVVVAASLPDGVAGYRYTPPVNA